MTVPGLTVAAVHHFFHAEAISTSGTAPVPIFIATAPPRLNPATTSCLRHKTHKVDLSHTVVRPNRE